MARLSGRCGNCGRVYYEDHKGTIVCDCYKVCPVCDAEMDPYMPDLAANTYGFDEVRDLHVLRVCSLHLPFFFSNLKPVEVELS